MSSAANSIDDCNKSNLSPSIADKAQRGETQLGKAQPGEAQLGEAQFGETQPDKAQLGEAQLGRKSQSWNSGRAPQRRTSYLFPATENLRPFRRKLRRIVNWPFLMLIKGYKLLLSPFMGRSCRFTPTCSTYTYEAIEKYGILKGGWLGLKRILRCNPWGGSGYDPVP